MYARLLLLRSSKLGCFPRRLASSSSGPRVPEQAVRAIFLIFRLSFLPIADRSIWPGPDDPSDWLTDFCIADSIFNTLGRACISIEHPSSMEKDFCNVERFLIINGTIKSRRNCLTWNETRAGDVSWNFLFFFLLKFLRGIKIYNNVCVKLKRYETDLGQNFVE